MSEFWSNSIKIVGLPGLPGLPGLVLFLFYFLMDKIFYEKLTAILGGNRIFVLIIIMFVLFSLFFIYSTFKTAVPKPNKPTDAPQHKNVPTEAGNSNLPLSPSGKIQTVEYRDNAKHDGDNNFS